MEHLTKQLYKVGDPIRVLSGGPPLTTKVEVINWDEANMDWKYFFKDEEGVVWSEFSEAIEPIKPTQDDNSIPKEITS